VGTRTTLAAGRWSVHAWERGPPPGGHSDPDTFASVITAYIYGRAERQRLVQHRRGAFPRLGDRSARQGAPYAGHARFGGTPRAGCRRRRKPTAAGAAVEAVAVAAASRPPPRRRAAVRRAAARPPASPPALATGSRPTIRSRGAPTPLRRAAQAANRCHGGVARPPAPPPPPPTPHDMTPHRSGNGQPGGFGGSRSRRRIKAGSPRVAAAAAVSAAAL